MTFLVDLKTERLFLKSLAESDLPAFHQVWTDPGATYWSFLGPCKTLEESQERMRRTTLQTDETSLKRSYGVFLHTDLNNCLGIVSLFPWFRDGPFEPLLGMVKANAESTWEAAYMYKTEAWGKGIGTEALQGVIASFAKERQGKESTIVAITNAANPGTLRVMEKTGFACQGPLGLGEGKVWIGGAWRNKDVLVWSRALSPEETQRMS